MLSWPLILLLLWSGAALGAEPGAERRAELSALVQAVERGEGAQRAIARLSYLDEHAHAGRLVLAALAKADGERVRRELVQLLSHVRSEQAQRALVALTGDEDRTVRMLAAQGLGRLKTKASGPALARLLRDDSAAVRRESARALGALSDRRLGRALVKAALVEGDLETRAAMLEAVGASGDVRQVPPLAKVLKTSSSGATRFAAARGLCLLGAPTGFAFAERLLRADDAGEREAALALLAGAPGDRPRAALRTALEDEAAAVRAFAARLLHDAGEPGMVRWLVLAAHHAAADTRRAYERHLEPLHLSDAERSAHLLDAGIGGGGR